LGKAQFLHEPAQRWVSPTGRGFSLLEAFYIDIHMKAAGGGDFDAVGKDRHPHRFMGMIIPVKERVDDASRTASGEYRWRSRVIPA